MFCKKLMIRWLQEMSGSKIIEIYNKGLLEVIAVIKTLSNQIKEENTEI